MGLAPRRTAIREVIDVQRPLSTNASYSCCWKTRTAKSGPRHPGLAHHPPNQIVRWTELMDLLHGNRCTDEKIRALQCALEIDFAYTFWVLSLRRQTGDRVVPCRTNPRPRLLLPSMSFAGQRHIKHTEALTRIVKAERLFRFKMCRAAMITLPM